MWASSIEPVGLLVYMNVPIPEPDEWSEYIPRLDKNCPNINPPTLVIECWKVSLSSVFYRSLVCLFSLCHVCSVRRPQEWDAMCLKLHVFTYPSSSSPVLPASSIFFCMLPSLQLQHRPAVLSRMLICISCLCESVWEGLKFLFLFVLVVPFVFHATVFYCSFGVSVCWYVCEHYVVTSPLTYINIPRPLIF